jgi:hypothetical protein
VPGIGDMSDSSRGDDLSQFSFEHQLHRLHARTAPPEPPPPKRRFVRELVLVGGIIAVVVLLSPFADIATPDYPAARTQADLLDTAYRSVWSGEASPEAAASATGLVVYGFPVDGRIVSVLTHAQPTADGSCYGLRTGGGFATEAVRFAPTDGCVPQGRSAFEAVGSWEEVLPSERMTAVWFIPALVVLIGSALALMTTIVMKLLLK